MGLFSFPSAERHKQVAASYAKDVIALRENVRVLTDAVVREVQYRQAAEARAADLQTALAAAEERVRQADAAAAALRDQLALVTEDRDDLAADLGRAQAEVARVVEQQAATSRVLAVVREASARGRTEEMSVALADANHRLERILAVFRRVLEVYGEPAAEPVEGGPEGQPARLAVGGRAEDAQEPADQHGQVEGQAAEVQDAEAAAG